MNKEKRKYYKVIVAAIVLLFACYQFSFRQSIELNKNIKELEAKSNMSGRLPIELDSIKKEIEAYNEILGNSNLSSSEIQEHILNISTQVCESMNDCRIISFPKEIVMYSEDTQIQISSVQLKGKFQPLLLFLNKIEKNIKTGRIISTQFESKRNYRTNSNELFLTIYIQNIKPISS